MYVRVSRVAHHILFYDYVEDILERRAPHREAHLERIRSEEDAGRVVMAGALGDPPHGAAIVFADGVEPTEVEAFAGGDPYVTAGLVTNRRIERWNVV
jgi:uncharacterized protein YciI